MPDVPIVDAHLHLWDPTYFRMSWLDGNALLDRRYDLAEYRAHTEGLDIAAMVYLQVEVEPALGLLEARWVAERAARDRRIGAIVAWAPCEYGDGARPYLDALIEVSPLVRGVRRLIQGQPPGFARNERFIRGVQLLSDYGLSFDICIKHHQMREAIDLVRRAPDVAFILDHIGKPDIAAGLMEPWRSELRELASFPNIICKISGMVTEADHRRWTVDDLRPYAEHVIECFGEDRVAFGGDWPVAYQAAPYRRWVAALEEITAGLSATARRKLWAENARRFYRLEP